MQQKITYQKVVFGFLVMVSLAVLQGCGSSTEIRGTTNVETTTVISTGTVETTGEVDAPANTGTQTTTTTTTSGTATTPPAKAALNGTFHLQTTYGSPAGPESLDATVTIESDIITAVSAINVAKAPQSKKFQDMFIKGIAGQVVGKNIKDVNVTYVNGSSLTAGAFNQALHDLQK